MRLKGSDVVIVAKEDIIALYRFINPSWSREDTEKYHKMDVMVILDEMRSIVRDEESYDHDVS